MYTYNKKICVFLYVFSHGYNHTWATLISLRYKINLTKAEQKSHILEAGWSFSHLDENFTISKKKKKKIGTKKKKWVLTWATLISPRYINSTNAKTSSYVVSFRITIWFFSSKDIKRFSKYELQADKTTLWHLMVLPSAANRTSVNCSLSSSREKTYLKRAGKFKLTYNLLIF